MKGPGGLLLALAVGTALGLGTGALLWRVASPTPETRSVEGSAASRAAPARELIALREQLEDERRRREAVEAQLAAADRATAVASDTADTEDPAEDAPVAQAAEPDGARSPTDPWIDGDLLARGGFREDDVEQLRAYFEAIQLDQLYLRDQATREGWVEEPRFRRRMAAIANRSAELRDQWGDDAYDWILYASGRPNRVVVESVMESSQAADLGIQPGDVFLRYEDERIFGVRALRRATTGGELGETATVVLRREGDSVRIFPERGPLGVALSMESLEPESPAY